MTGTFITTLLDLISLHICSMMIYLAGLNYLYRSSGAGCRFFSTLLCDNPTSADGNDDATWRSFHQSKGAATGTVRCG